MHRERFTEFPNAIHRERFTEFPNAIHRERFTEFSQLDLSDKGEGSSMPRSLRIAASATLFAELNDTALYGSQRQVLGHAVK
nr:hypothetical protein [Leptospira santarosai]